VIVLEDIDALLVPGSHSFFLNELDGFASNAGVITLATTNHPERLDPSIVDRPSRFDRKYHFELPDESTRREYSAMWNARLEPALRMRADEIDALAVATAGFSFAYIQEVFVSAMMRWMVARDAGGIATAANEQVALLREQMATPSLPQHR
jgi:ATP-dependent 26S proteasome regulatory subunit